MAGQCSPDDHHHSDSIRSAFPKLKMCANGFYFAFNFMGGESFRETLHTVEMVFCCFILIFIL